jgi:hypothetical protein
MFSCGLVERVHTLTTHEVHVMVAFHGHGDHHLSTLRGDGARVIPFNVSGRPKKELIVIQQCKCQRGTNSACQQLPRTDHRRDRMSDHPSRTRR